MIAFCRFLSVYLLIAGVKAKAGIKEKTRIRPLEESQKIRARKPLFLIGALRGSPASLLSTGFIKSLNKNCNRGGNLKLF